MNNNQNSKILYGIGGLIIGILLVSLFIPMMRYGGMMSWGGNQNSYSRTAGIDSLDQHFIEQMIPHHEGAIAMADLALEKATRPEIKTLAEAILKAQTAENQEMRAWYQDWFGKNVPTGTNLGMGGMMSQGGMHMGSTQDIDVLKNAPDFDKEFIEQMIPHHQMAIMMARMLESGTNRPEMLQLAKNIQTSQAAEIQQMQGWYTSWYK
jgi:uncharacterized protein (DUF305 family)